MGAVKFQKDSVEWNLFTDYWKLCQNIGELLNGCEPKYRLFFNDLICALSAIEKYDKEECRKIFNDYWMVCKAIWEVEDHDQYWSDVISLVDTFYKKYKTVFAKKLSLALTNELDRRFKEGRFDKNEN